MTDRLPFQMMSGLLGGLALGIAAHALPVAKLGDLRSFGIVLGVDRFLDMCRTAVNVTGDRAAAVVVSRGEPRELDPASA